VVCAAWALKSDIREVEIPDGERAHYSKRTVDFHFNYPHKFDEIGGWRTAPTLTSKSYRAQRRRPAVSRPNTNEKFVPHVLEPTFGLGRHVLAVLAKAYTEDELGGEPRVYLKFPPHLAPVKAACFRCLKTSPSW
jgi:glycyl-tRNA synthetase